MPNNICIVINSLSGGGAERVVANLCAYLVTKGKRVTLVTLHSTDDSYPLAEAVNRVSVNAQAARGSGFMKAISAVRSVLKDIKPDYVLGMMTVPSLVCLFAAVGLPVRVVISERNHPPRKKAPLRWRLLRWLSYRFSYASVVLANQTASWMVARGCRNVHVIPVSVDLPLPIMAPMVAVADLISPHDFVFLAVGRLHPQKGFDLLIEAFSKALPSCPEAKLVLLGEGAERAKLSHLARELSVSERVLMPGRAGNIGDWYSRADVFVFSSRYEGFGNALVEACASGCASISFDCEVGPAEVIVDGQSGLLVPPEDVNKLADAMSSLARDSSLRARLAQQARAIGENYAGDRVLRRWMDVFR
ncbi:glycosyltransferase family 4 protein [Stutzerimonas balearica]|uniref:glycosyltransferase family 4 protein n=1 Tax=Stutzerimonas balearica TaxID=74829 RepID=UPI003F7603F0